MPQVVEVEARQPHRPNRCSPMSGTLEVGAQLGGERTEEAAGDQHDRDEKASEESVRRDDQTGRGKGARRVDGPEADRGVQISHSRQRARSGPLLSAPERSGRAVNPRRRSGSWRGRRCRCWSLVVDFFPQRCSNPAVCPVVLCEGRPTGAPQPEDGEDMSDPYLTGMAWLIEHQSERDRRRSDARMGEFAAAWTCGLRRTVRRSRRGNHAAARGRSEPP